MNGDRATVSGAAINGINVGGGRVVAWIRLGVRGGGLEVGNAQTRRQTNAHHTIEAVRLAWLVSWRWKLVPVMDVRLLVVTHGLRGQRHDARRCGLLLAGDSM